MTDVMAVSKAGDSFFSQMGGDHKLAVTAFKGYTPYYKNAVQGRLNHGSSGLRWAEQLLQGIRDDDPDMCGVAMQHDGSSFGIKVEQRGLGAPFRFETAGFFTQAQIQENVDDLTKKLTKRVEDSKIFVSNNEWTQIHQYIQNAGAYSDPRFKVAVKGDSALMIAVRLRSFKAAKYLLRSGVDAAMTNSKGETIAEVIESKQAEILKERNHIRFLRVQAKSVRQMALSHEDHMALLSEPQIYHQLEQGYELCKEISKLMEVRATNVKLMIMKQKLLQVEGKTVEPEEQAEIDLQPIIVQSKKIVDKLIKDVAEVVVEWEGSQLAKDHLKQKKEQEKVNEKEEKIKYWKTRLFNAACKIQAAWRGVTVREMTKLLTLHRACTYVQCRTRGYLYRSKMRRDRINDVVVMMQSVCRGYNGRKRAARKAGRVYPATALIVALRKACRSGGEEGKDEGEVVHVPAVEYVRDLFGEMDKPPLANTKTQPKGQWAMLRYMGQRKALDEAKNAALDDRKNGEIMAKLAALCLEHGKASSNFTSIETRKGFVKSAAVLYFKALEAKKDVAGVAHMFHKRRGEAMLHAFIDFDIENDHAYLVNAIESFSKALMQVECTVIPDVWFNKATAQEFNGDIDAAIKTVAAMVRKFPNFDKADEVSMKAAALHMCKEDYGKACAYVRHASLSGRGSMFLSHMDLILISGRMNELWYYKLLEEFPDDDDGDSDSDESFYDGESDEEEGESEEELRKKFERKERKKSKPEKYEASQKAYRLVYRHFVEHRNIWGKRTYESWINHPATWIKVATRASLSGLYLLAEDLYMEALHRCKFWDLWEKRAEVEDLEDGREDVSSEEGEVEEEERSDFEGNDGKIDVNSDAEGEKSLPRVTIKEGGEGRKATVKVTMSFRKMNLGGDGEEEEEGEQGENHQHFHNLGETAVRILFEIAKCKWYHGNFSEARSYLEKAKDEELWTKSKGKHDFVASANLHWNPANMHKLEKERKVLFPSMVANIPQL
ncbi:hypothetical protein TrLO_g12863 [Triparma laevis f. longispina]|uniref:Uncharacterized protein n=1 Tax=Triparma laevis f. longispina TaxID=1714387 RepID=A0A9W7FQS4_9STRA|nr:hypothetical protein TrLO_g12863 [Triparma laevis f. longispina]